MKPAMEFEAMARQGKAMEVTEWWGRVE